VTTDALECNYVIQKVTKVPNVPSCHLPPLVHVQKSEGFFLNSINIGPTLAIVFSLRVEGAGRSSSLRLGGKEAVVLLLQFAGFLLKG
jgi:hypothetical protein